MQELQDDTILAFQQGDGQAFKTIFRQFYEPLFTFCKYMVDAEQAKDITAETFVKLWQMRERWASTAHIKAFLYVTAKNACFNHLEHEKIKAQKLRELSASTFSQQTLMIHAEVETELIRRIKIELENLPANAKTVFTLAFLEGYKNPEIAEKLDLNIQTVKNLKSLALKSIKSGLIKKGFQMSFVLLVLQFLQDRPGI